MAHISLPYCKNVCHLKRDVILDFLNSVFITSITLFLQLYKVVIIFLGCLENNEKVQLKIWIMHSKKQTNKKQMQAE